MRVAITGGTGFLGTRLAPHLAEVGHAPVLLVRERPGRDLAALAAACPSADVRAYAPLDVASVRAAVDDCDAVINLAGESVLGGRWSTAFLGRLRHSRIATTRVLVEALQGRAEPPQVLLSASAVGIYGARAPEDECTEATEDLGHDFLAILCRDWEAAAQHAVDGGTRVVLLRLGVVLGRGGGALARMEGPVRWFVGGRIGSGRQVMSWIHVEDAVRLVRFALEREDLQGPLNLTAPYPVSNAELTKALAGALRRPAFLPVPALALKAWFGRGASVLTSGQRVVPAAALEAGFSFRYEAVGEAMAAVYPRA